MRGGVAILDDVDFCVMPGDRWVVIGPNGSGKTTLLLVMGMRLLPTTGIVEVLGERARRTDVREMRRRVALVSQSTLRQLRPSMGTFEAVISGRNAALETWWHDYTRDDHERARGLLQDAGLQRRGDVEFGLLSEGERQQVLLARALMAEPEMLLLDEPAAGLDLAAREHLVARLDVLAADRRAPAMVLVTHHTEEIPPAMTHAALMADARILMAGAVDDALTAGAVSEAFGTRVTVDRLGGRWFARCADR